LCWSRVEKIRGGVWWVGRKKAKGGLSAGWGIKPGFEGGETNKRREKQNRSVCLRVAERLNSQRER